jgi:hypothetical protein
VSDSGYLRTQAARCRRLARATSDEGVAETLNGMADDYDRQASEEDKPAAPPPS